MISKESILAIKAVAKKIPTAAEAKEEFESAPNDSHLAMVFRARWVELAEKEVWDNLDKIATEDEALEFVLSAPENSIARNLYLEKLYKIEECSGSSTTEAEVLMKLEVMKAEYPSKDIVEHINDLGKGNKPCSPLRVLIEKIYLDVYFLQGKQKTKETDEKKLVQVA